MGGTPGLFRLFSQQLAGQISWLLPLATVGLVAAWRSRFRLSLNRQQQSLVLWSAWLLTHMIVFSYAQGTFHEYYTVTG
jgi:4-amino-4-deoxy-L-arabinose transferase-like glycosyltransferase